MAQLPISIAELYPSLRGDPKEGSQHWWGIVSFAGALDAHYWGREDAYVTGDQLIYYELGDPTKKIVADAIVVLGVPGLGAMGAYRVWEIGKAPDLAFDVVLPNTKRKHLLEVPRAYAAMGVRECWRFYPEAEGTAALAGYRLERGVCWPMPVVAMPNGAVVGCSKVLGMFLEAERLRPGARPAHGAWGLFLRDVATDEPLPDPLGKEKHRAREPSEQRGALAAVGTVGCR